MANLTPQQAVWQRRVEAAISLASPALDLLLAVGDRLSRIVEPSDHEYYPVGSGGDSSLPEGSGRSRSRQP